MPKNERKEAVPRCGTLLCSATRYRRNLRHMSDNDTRPGIEVLNRAVDILEAFTHAPTPTLRLADLAQRTGLPKATLHRLLAALEVQGLVERTDGGHQLGIRLFELGEHVPRKTRLREAALPFMQDLFEATHDTVHLGVLEGTEVVYLERIRGHRSGTLPSRVGGRLPAYCTGVGKAMLAYLPPEALEAALARQSFHRFTPHTLASRAALLEELEAIRKRGHAWDAEEHEAGIICCAVPILSRRGRVMGALSVTSTTARTTLAALGGLAPMIKDIAAKIAAEAESWRFPEQVQPGGGNP